jgi:hypothetical protein
MVEHKVMGMEFVGESAATTFKRRKQTRCQWLMPAILVTWEAEIRRIVVEGSLGK